MIDIIRTIEAVEREVREGQLPAGAGKTIRLSRDYDAPIADVWDALTDPARISRWFLPVSGDLRLGGRYQLEGNAGGEIVACERPNRLLVTWAYGEVSSDADISHLELRLSSVDDATTRFELEHTAIVPDEFWAQYGPGAVGIGWDQAVLGLGLFLATGATVGDATAWQLSAEGIEFSTRASEAWGAANLASGADPEAAATAVAGSTAFYTTDPNAAQ
jgi:uncharacterized protein YndB with AHSA1/START domain